jgi:lipoprotein-releasing system permease protein
VFVFRPAWFFIGLRYTKAKRRNHFISFISLTSMLGIALGVMVLITVLSVMNGFDDEIKSRIFGMAPHITIHHTNDAIPAWRPLLADVKRTSGVVAAAPFVSGQVMLASSGLVHGALLNGIDPALESGVSGVGHKMVKGSLNALIPGSFGIVLGQELAENLGLQVGDKVTVVTPEATVSPVGVLPRLRQFSVAGIFHAGSGFYFDSQLALINLQDAQALFQMNGAISGINLKVTNLYMAPAFASLIADHLPNDFYVSDWSQQYGPLFKAIKLEKTMMFLILLLIIAVAAFNLVATLVMIVNDKRADIAILRTLGATPLNVMGVFVVQGFVVGVVGVILGLIGGILLAYNVTPIVNGIESLFHVQLLSSNIYYVNYLPSKLDWYDVTKIACVALMLSLIATLYPAFRAARTQPAEALRYE